MELRVSDTIRSVPHAARTFAVSNKWMPSLYFVFGQVGWFGCVLSAARGSQWIGVLLVGVLLTIHLVRAARPIEELKLLISVAAIGGAWDSAVRFSGVLVYPSSTVNGGLAPCWILALWVLFAAQFNTTYKWLKTRLKIAALLGAVAGPLSFRAGAALGALRFAKPWPAVVMIAIGWALLLPAIAIMSRRWDGVRSGSV